jgi:hypothetical protein
VIWHVIGLDGPQHPRLRPHRLAQSIETGPTTRQNYL